jgi:hypothetical protein
MRIFIGTLLMTTAITVHVANAAATIPDYQPRPGKPASSNTTTDPHNANAAMPYRGPTSNPSRFFEIPAKR